MRTSSNRTRYMKGKQIPMTVYLEPKRYWLLKWLSRHKGLSMQALIRQIIDQVLDEAARVR
jgi:predicted DNA-binding ribbon-helix-helix protein